MAEQVVIADEGRRKVAIGGRAVAQRRGLNRNPAFHRSGEQPRVEGQHLPPIGGRALGENHHHAALLQMRHQTLHQRGGCALAATDVEGAQGAGQPAGDGPVAHFRLRDEPRRLGGQKDENIQPRDVVGHGDTAALCGAAVTGQLDAENAQQPDGPPLAQPGGVETGRWIEFDRRCQRQPAGGVDE